MAITLTGMASGLDTDSIISQLMAIEQNKVTAVQRRQTSVTQHKTDLASIKTKLDAVKTAAADLTSASLWKPAQTTSSSDPTKVDAQSLARTQVLETWVAGKKVWSREPSASPVERGR